MARRKQGRLSAQWAKLDPEEYAFTRAVAEQMRTHDDRAEFLAGIDLILAGMTPARRPARSATPPAARISAQRKHS